MNIEDDKIFVSGHRGMVGSAIVRSLQGRGAGQILTCPRIELDLTIAQDVATFLADHKPDAVIVGAAKVGGIYANDTYPAEFIYDNLAIAMNLIHGAYKAGVPRLLFLGSSCIYPRQAPQPMKEEYLLTGPLEPTNEAYAIAKISGLKMCQYYRKQYGVLYHSGMPTNLYGPGDNYHAENSHVIPALIRRFHEAKVKGLPEVTIWGSGQPRREFLHVDDLARGILTLLEADHPTDVVNLGCGEDVSIAELAGLVKEAVGYEGTITYDATKPDGTPRKLLDVTRIRAMGWAPRVELAEGLKQVYADFCKGYREA
ncbi:MAG: GDP-L-fucose synthase [Candidatus Omnitrophota bacterium]|jgi:GDP-L-fucose synthase